MIKRHSRGQPPEVTCVPVSSFFFPSGPPAWSFQFQKGKLISRNHLTDRQWSASGGRNDAHTRDRGRTGQIEFLVKKIFHYQQPIRALDTGHVIFENSKNFQWTARVTWLKGRPPFAQLRAPFRWRRETDEIAVTNATVSVRFSSTCPPTLKSPSIQRSDGNEWKQFFKKILNCDWNEMFRIGRVLLSFALTCVLFRFKVKASLWRSRWVRRRRRWPRTPRPSKSPSTVRENLVARHVSRQFLSI